MLLRNCLRWNWNQNTLSKDRTNIRKYLQNTNLVLIFTEDGWVTKPELAQFYKSLPALPVPLYWLKTVTVNMTKANSKPGSLGLLF